MPGSQNSGGSANRVLPHNIGNPSRANRLVEADYLNDLEEMMEGGESDFDLDDFEDDPVPPRRSNLAQPQVRQAAAPIAGREESKRQNNNRFGGFEDDLDDLDDFLGGVGGKAASKKIEVPAKTAPIPAADLDDIDSFLN